MKKRRLGRPKGTSSKTAVWSRREVKSYIKTMAKDLYSFLNEQAKKPSSNRAHY